MFSKLLEISMCMLCEGKSRHSYIFVIMLPFNSIQIYSQGFLGLGRYFICELGVMTKHSPP